MSDTPNKYRLEDRTLQFSVRVIKHCMRIKQPRLQSITNQLIRSATSVGANYAEANNASSKTDFRAKIFIAKKEAAETKYWLKILIELGDKSEEIMYLQEETQGILMTLQKIISTLKAKSENGER
ncbi:four helix bundle protein [Candidatus Nomurabacteria bacterium]|jgi:four helix bundle protein|nr:four helix bundle protein [Candidatus Saccharibacteria bacterium]MCB9822575.1 four helix bundle protein [Candidatus Nomurabacteria bacterium]